jgi:hypothetical protein
MFEISSPVVANNSAERRNRGNESIIEPSNVGEVPRMTAGGLHKIFLPARSGESRFAPRQYYYPASRTGVVPSRSNSAT